MTIKISQKQKYFQEEHMFIFFEFVEQCSLSISTQ